MTTPFLITFTPNGAFAYVTQGIAGTVSVIDTATNIVTATIPVGVSPRAMDITPNGAFAYVANFESGTVSVIDTATNTVSATVSVLSASGVAVRPDGAYVYEEQPTFTSMQVKGERSDGIIETKVHVDPVAVAIDGSPFRAVELYLGRYLANSCDHGTPSGDRFRHDVLGNFTDAFNGGGYVLNENVKAHS
jgi:YVTN family beta-propeller protein